MDLDLYQTLSESEKQKLLPSLTHSSVPIAACFGPAPYSVEIFNGKFTPYPVAGTPLSGPSQAPFYSPGWRNFVEITYHWKSSDGKLRDL